MVLGRLCPCCGMKDAWVHEFALKPPAEAGDFCQPVGHSEEKLKKFQMGVGGGQTNSKPAEVDLSIYELPKDTPVVQLKAKEAFDLLTKDEKAYAYYHGKSGV